jgi:trans-aconitate methyltransferase
VERAEARAWFERWDAQQSGIIGVREERFRVMLDVLADTFDVDDDITVIDLASGPAGISMRVLDRFPKARAVAVDNDPVLLAIGRGAHGDRDGRLQWVEHDLRDPAWSYQVRERAGRDDVDAVLTSTALHWIPTGALTDVYRACSAMLRPHGLLINCDNMDYPPTSPIVRRIAETMRARDRADNAEAAAALEFESYDDWWGAVATSPSLADLHREREQRYAWRDRDEYRPGFEVHVALLREAGFEEIETVWQRYQNRVLVAVRSEAGPVTIPHR